tara:strand:+ start:288 stop:914 length:627 start_codon:yes stop_codon:yes gene_type:complete
MEIKQVMDLTVAKELFIEPIREELEEAASLTPLWGIYKKGLVWHSIECRALGERLPNPRTILREVDSTKAIVKEGAKFSKRACWTIARDGTSELCISGRGPGCITDYHVLRHLREAEEKGEEDALLLFWLIYYHRVFRGRQGIREEVLDGYIAMLMVREYLSFIKYINFNHAWLREGYCTWSAIPDTIGPAIKKIMETEETKGELHGN